MLAAESGSKYVVAPGKLENPPQPIRKFDNTRNKAVQTHFSPMVQLSDFNENMKSESEMTHFLSRAPIRCHAGKATFAPSLFIELHKNQLNLKLI